MTDLQSKGWNSFLCSWVKLGATVRETSVLGSQPHTTKTRSKPRGAGYMDHDNNNLYIYIYTH